MSPAAAQALDNVVARSKAVVELLSGLALPRWLQEECATHPDVLKRLDPETFVERLHERVRELCFLLAEHRGLQAQLESRNTLELDRVEATIELRRIEQQAVSAARQAFSGAALFAVAIAVSFRAPAAPATEEGV